MIGREEELARLVALLQSGSPWIALVTGGPGSGKTTLLQALARQAAETGWTVVGPISVSPGTDRDDFTRPLRDLIAYPAQLPGVRPLERPEDLLGRRAGDSTEGATTAEEAGSPLLLALRRRRPLLLVVDGYRPSLDFHRWLFDRFLPDAFASRGSVGALFAESQQDAGRIRSRVDVELSLEPVSEAKVRPYFEMIGNELSPPADRNEIDAFVDAVVKRPELIDPLVRALGLARRGDVSRERSYG